MHPQAAIRPCYDRLPVGENALGATSRANCYTERGLSLDDLSEEDMVNVEKDYQKGRCD
jgi:hypothetical protein